MVAYSKRTGLSPVPDVGKVAGQAAGNDEQGVDADVIAVSRIARRKLLRGDRDTAKTIFVERPCRRLRGAALLDFYEGKYPAAAGDEVDFAARNASSTGENPPAV